VIEITSNAAVQVRALLEGKGLDPASAGLRLAIEKGGCAGLQYVMTLGAAEPDDSILEKDGARVFIDRDSATWLEGSTLDYEDGLAGAGFRIHNPQATRNCGCGTSFEPASTAARS